VDIYIFLYNKTNCSQTATLTIKRTKHKHRNTISNSDLCTLERIKLTAQITVLTNLQLHIANGWTLVTPNSSQAKSGMICYPLQYMTFVLANTGTAVALSSGGKLHKT